MTNNFADRLHASIERSNSFLCAGYDPRLEAFPAFILEQASKEHSDEEAIYRALTGLFECAIEPLAPKIAAVKPNSAFFEAFGLGGLRALASIGAMLRERGLPCILDAKRGDIGATAAAYSSAYLGRASALGRSFRFIDADALTVNPFLGFDTLEPFVKDCQEHGKGIFVLVKTSNPGSKALQSATAEGSTVSERIADWLAAEGEALRGACGYSSLGAVVGATYPEEARALRARMPANLFLIPGVGTQGGSAEDAVAGFGRQKARGGAVVNVSRGLLSSFSSTTLSREELCAELAAKAQQMNEQLAVACQK